MAIIPLLPPFLYILFLNLCLFRCAHSQTPATKPFTFTNTGDLVHNAAEYGATYREIPTFSTFPFTLCFYNSTPGKYILAVRGGDRWVWEANRRRPVGERATLTLRQDGNLVLAEPNGAIAWQTSTSGKSVAGIKLLTNGNLILHDKRGNPVWQSFDHPVDTLLAGMSLKLNSTRLISRRSATDPADGPYSLILEDRGIIAYLNNSGELIRYADLQGRSGDAVTYVVQNPNTKSTDLILKYEGPPPGTSVGGIWLLKTINYKTNYSFLRLSTDGNLIAYSSAASADGWVQSFAYFPDYHPRECALPAKCGVFGLCENNTCVGCPSPKGASPWSLKCAPPLLGRCGSGERVRYYKIEGAQHFQSLLQSGNIMSLGECRKSCTKDCNCKGFVYQRRISECLTVTLLATLIRDTPEYTFYVKYLK